MIFMTSKEMRENPLFMRNNFKTSGRWELPLIKRQKLNSEDIALIPYSDTRAHDSASNTQRGVHFFVDDYRFTGIYNNPEKSPGRLMQYAFLLSPDYSTYADMNDWRQLESVAHSRWVGAFWQSKEAIVYPTISWSTPSSYDFCFEGIERGSIVAVGMIGCKQNKISFMRGYNVMLDKIDPEKVIVFGRPYPEMKGSLITVDYSDSRREAV